MTKWYFEEKKPAGAPLSFSSPGFGSNVSSYSQRVAEQREKERLQKLTDINASLSSPVKEKENEEMQTSAQKISRVLLLLFALVIVA
jgi:hypothetical protein